MSSLDLETIGDRLIDAFTRLGGQALGLNAIDGFRLYHNDPMFHHQVNILVMTALAAINDEPIEEVEEVRVAQLHVEHVRQFKIDTEAFWRGFRGE